MCKLSAGECKGALSKPKLATPNNITLLNIKVLHPPSARNFAKNYLQCMLGLPCKMNSTQLSIIRHVGVTARWASITDLNTELLL